MYIKDLLRRTLWLFIASSFVLSCMQEGEETVINENQVPDEVLSILSDNGFDVTNIARHQFETFDGNFVDGYLVEEDIHMTHEEVMSMSTHLHNLPTGEQYRTNNLVSAPRTIKVLGHTGGSKALTNKMKKGLKRAVKNFNNLNLDLTFELSFGSNTNGYDIVVFKVNGSAGGSAGFPKSNGNPHKNVKINSGTNSYSVDVNEHVITHEIGHCVGLRHTDYFNRSLSCGSGGNEGPAGVGAVHIPGTPTGTDKKSIMQACFGAGTKGEFSNKDKVALRYLY